VRNLEREIANILRKIARDAVKSGATEPAPAQTAPEASVATEAHAASETAAVPEAPADGAVEIVAGDAVSPVAAHADPPQGTAADADRDPPLPTVDFKVVVTGRSVEKYLGKEKFLENNFSQDVTPGLAYGLAWTELGGQLLPVEVSIVAGKGELTLTGSLGDVMKESAQAALTFLRAHHAALGISADFTKDRDIHIHVPEGAIPKDGPSAGITLAAALLSAVARVAVAPGFAMTGEITLTGRILPIGGVKEKVLAAHRYKMTRVLLPRRNEKDLEEIPAEVMRQLHFEFADTVLDALAILFPARSFEAGDDSPRPEGIVDALRRNVPPTPPARPVEPSLDQPSL
jgi:ATP-dependent Lon protease